jgi:hypothetical protein
MIAFGFGFDEQVEKLHGAPLDKSTPRSCIGSRAIARLLRASQPSACRCVMLSLCGRKAPRPQPFGTAHSRYAVPCQLVAPSPVPVYRHSGNQALVSCRTSDAKVALSVLGLLLAGLLRLPGSISGGAAGTVRPPRPTFRIPASPGFELSVSGRSLVPKGRNNALKFNARHVCTSNTTLMLLQSAGPDARRRSPGHLRGSLVLRRPACLLRTPHRRNRIELT